MSLGDPAPWLLLLAAAHLGFQLTVDLVVYPTLRDTPFAAWGPAHDRHSRRITPVVALVYPPLVLVLLWAVLTDPARPSVWVAVLGGLLSVAATGLVAAPTHGRLGDAGDEATRDRLMQRLMAGDRVRTAGAVLCAAGALLAAV